MTKMPHTMADLEAVLASYPHDCQPAGIESLGSAGGMSGAQFWRLKTSRGVLALRRWPTEHPAPDRLRFIHAVLNHAGAQGTGVLPLPVTTRTAESFVTRAGHLWELAPWMRGVADYERAPSTEKLNAAMRTLAEFHVAVAGFPDFPVVGASNELNAVDRHLGRLRELTPTRINDLAGTITETTWPDLSPLARYFVAQLPVAIPRALALLDPLSSAPLPLQPCLKDIWHDHVLFTDNRVTGVVDFGAVAIDTPATDITRLLGSLISLTPLPFEEGQGEGSVSRTIAATQLWSNGLAAYNDLRKLSPYEIAAARALATSGAILAGCNWIPWIYDDGRQFEDHHRIIERFKRIVAAIANDQSTI